MKRIAQLVAMGAMAVAALLWGTAQGAVYDETTGYVRLLRNGSSANVYPLSTNAVYDSTNGGNTDFLWSDHLALHAGTNYYANIWFRGWPRASTDPAVIYPIPCNRFVLDSGATINWKCGYPSVIVFENEGLFAQGGSIFQINADNCLLGGVGGTVTIQASSASKTFTWLTSSAKYATIGHGYYVVAKVVGDADQVMRITTPADASGRVYFMGDMSDYLGTINTISNILYAGTSLATKEVNATRCGEVCTHGADGAEIFIPKVTLDATSVIGCAATNTLVVGTLTMADGSTVRGFVNEAGAGGCVTVTDAFTAPGKIRVTVDMPVNGATNAVTRVAVMRVAKSAGTVAQAQLEIGERSCLAGAKPAVLPNMTELEVADEGDWTVVYAIWRQVIRQVVAIPSASETGWFNLASTWSNNKTPSQNAGLDFYSSVNCYLPKTFPGNSFITTSWITLSNNGTYDFPLLMMNAGAEFRMWPRYLVTFNVAMTVNGTSSQSLTWRFGQSTTNRLTRPITSAVTQIAGIRAVSSTTDHVSSLRLAADNTETFTGKWIVRHLTAAEANPTQYMAFAVCEQANLGKPFDTFTYDALKVENWQSLEPDAANVVLDDMTRGIWLVGNAQLITPEGEQTLALKSPLTFSGVARKSGPGTLALGGTVKPKFCGADQSATPLAGTNGLLVTEGWIKPISTNGVDGLAVEFAGGGIRLDHAPADAGVAAYGFWNTKWSAPFARAEGVTGKVPVSIDMGELTDVPSPVSRYAICTVAADKAADVKGMLDVQRPFKGYVTGVEERANADGTVTLLAVVRYGGLTMIIR